MQVGAWICGYCLTLSDNLLLRSVGKALYASLTAYLGAGGPGVPRLRDRSFRWSELDQYGVVTTGPRADRSGRMAMRGPQTERRAFKRKLFALVPGWWTTLAYTGPLAPFGVKTRYRPLFGVIT